MLVMGTTKRPAHPVGEFIRAQQSVELHHLALAMNPFGLDGVQPRTLLREKATDDPHPTAALLHFSVVFAEPAPHLPGDVPACIVPDQKKGLLANSFEPLATPREKPRAYGAHGPTVDEPYPHMSSSRGRCRGRSRIWPSAQGRPWRPTVGSCEGAHPPQRRRSKWAAPPGSTSIRPKSRWPTEGRRRLSPSVGRAAFFSFVQGIWGGDPPLGPLPAYAQKKREGGADGLPRDPLFGEALLEGGLGGHISRVHRLLSYPNSLGERCSIPRSRSAEFASKAACRR